MGNNFGFTNDKSYLDKVISFKLAAIKDGWSHEPTYGTHESEERACKLSKEGFTMMILSRTRKSEREKWDYEASINIWGPDGLYISQPEEYNWNEIVAGLTHCNYCGDNGVKTFRVSFAGRCCEKCLPEMKKEHEYPGWEN